MTNVRFIGDIHGQFGTYFQTIQGAENTIQVGDYGIGFGPVPINVYAQPGNHRFIRGNHDNLQRCFGERGFIKDGTVEKYGDNKVMFVGGAYSIDQDWRTPGVSWWDDEELSYSELLDMIDIYDREKPDMMVTHEVPESLMETIFSADGRSFTKFDIPSRTRNAFDNMLAIHRPKLWIFGHWHRNARVNIDGTLFMCLDCHNYVDVNMDTLVPMPIRHVHDTEWMKEG
jgi:predicted phosphohydrolase